MAQLAVSVGTSILSVTVVTLCGLGAVLLTGCIAIGHIVSEAMTGCGVRISDSILSATAVATFCGLGTILIASCVAIGYVVLESVSQLAALIGYGLGLATTVVTLCGLGAVSLASCVAIALVLGEAVTLCGTGIGLGLSLATVVITACGLSAVSLASSIVVAYEVSEAVAQCGTGIGYGIGCVTVVTLCGLGAVLGAGCVAVAHVVGEAMTASGDSLGNAMQLVATDGAVGDHIVRTIIAAGCFNAVFFHRLTGHVDMVSEQIQLCAHVGDVCIDICAVALNSNDLVNFLAQVAAVVLTAICIGLLQCAQSTVEAGAELSQHDASHIDYISEAHFVAAQSQNLLQSALRQADLLSDSAEGLVASVVLQGGNSLLNSQLIECSFQLLLVGAAGLVEGLDSLDHSCSDFGIALSQDHSHHDGVSVVSGEVDHNGTSVITGDQNALALAGNALHIGEVGSNRGSICQAASQHCQTIIEVAGQNQLQGAFLQSSTGAQGQIQNVSFCVALHSHIPCGGGEVVSSQNTIGLQSMLDLLEVGNICNQYIYQLSQVGSNHTTQCGVDCATQTIVAGQDAQDIVDAQIKDGLAVHSHSCSIIMSNCQFGYDIQSQADQMLSGSDLSCSLRIQGHDHIAALLLDGEVLVADHTVHLLVTGLQICRNVSIVLTAQDGQVLAGNSTGDSTVSSIVAVNQEGSAALSDDIAVNGLAVQVQYHSLAQLQINRILRSTHIVQQDHSIAVGNLGQFLSGQHDHSLVQADCLHSIQIDGHCNIFLIQVLNVSLNGHIQAGVVLSDHGGQLRSSHTGGQLHCIDLALQLINHLADGQCVQINVGNALVVAVVAELLVLQHILQDVEDRVAHIHGNACQTNSICNGLVGHIVRHSGIQHINQIANSYFCVQCVHIVNVSLADHSQSANICGVHSLGQFAGELDLAILQSDFCVMVLSERNQISQLLQRIVSACSSCLGRCQSDVEGEGSVVVEGQSGLHQNTALSAGSAVVDDLILRNSQIVNNITVSIDQLQNTIGVDTGVEQCIHQGLHVVLVVVQQVVIAQHDRLAAAGEQTHSEGSNAAFHIGQRQRQNHHVALLRILDQGNTQRVSLVDQLNFCHIDSGAGNGDLTISQHCLNLSGAEGILGSSGGSAIDGVLIHITGEGVCRQLDLAAIDGNGAQLMLAHVNGVFLSGVSDIDGLRTGNQIAVTGHNAVVMHLHVVGQTSLSGQSSDSALQLGSVQIAAGGHGPGFVGEGSACEGYINNNSRVAGRGAGNGLHPSHGCRSLSVLLRLCGLQIVQQSLQGSQSVLANDHQRVVDCELSVQLVALFQRSLCSGEAGLVLAGQHAHQLSIFNHQAQQVIQLIDLCQISGLVGIEVIQTICLIAFQCDAEGQIAIVCNQLCQRSCRTGGGGQEAAVGSLSQSCSCIQQLRHGVLTDRCAYRIVLVDLLQVGHLSKQAIQRVSLIGSISLQLVRNVHDFQQLGIGNAQSSGGQSQLIVHICHLEAAGGVSHAIFQRESGIVQTTAGSSPLQVAHTGSDGQSLDNHLTGSLVEVDAQVIVLGNHDADAAALFDGRAHHDLLQHCIHLGVALHNQSGQILLLGHCALLTGNGGVLGNLNDGTLVQVVQVIDRVDVFAVYILVVRQSQLIAVGHCGGQAMALFEAFAVSHIHGLGCVSNGIYQIGAQSEVSSQLIGLPVVVFSGDHAFPQRLCQSSSIGSDLSDCIHDLLLVGALTQSDHGSSVVGQSNGLLRVHLGGIHDLTLHHNLDIVHTHVVADGSGLNEQLFLPVHIGGLQVACPLGQLVIVRSLCGVDHLGSVPAVALSNLVNVFHAIAQQAHDHDQQVQHGLVFLSLSLGSQQLGLLLLCQHLRSGDLQLSSLQLCLRISDLLLCLGDLALVEVDLSLGGRQLHIPQVLHHGNCFISLTQGGLAVLELLDIASSVVQEILRCSIALIQKCSCRCNLVSAQHEGKSAQCTLCACNACRVLNVDHACVLTIAITSQQFFDLCIQRCIGVIGFQESNCAVDIVSVLDLLGVTQLSQHGIQLVQLVSALSLGSCDQIVQILCAVDLILAVTVRLQLLVDLFIQVNAVQLSLNGFDLLQQSSCLGLVVGDCLRSSLQLSQSGFQLHLDHSHVFQQVFQLLADTQQTVVSNTLNVLIVGHQCAIQLSAVEHHPLQVAVGSMICQELCQGQASLVVLLLVPQTVDRLHGLTVGTVVDEQIVLAAFDIDAINGNALELNSVDLVIAVLYAVELHAIDLDAGNIHLRDLDGLLVSILSQVVDHVHHRLHLGLLALFSRCGLECLQSHEGQNQLGSQGDMVTHGLVDHSLNLGICKCIFLVIFGEDVCSAQSLQDIDVLSQTMSSLQQSLLLSCRHADLQLVGDFHGELQVGCGVLALVDAVLLGQRQVIMIGDHAPCVLQIEAYGNPQTVVLFILECGNKDLLVFLIHTDDAAISNFLGRHNVGVTLVCLQCAGADDSFLVRGQLVIAYDQLAKHRAVCMAMLGAVNTLRINHHIAGRHYDNQCQQHCSPTLRPS